MAQVIVKQPGRHQPSVSSDRSTHQPGAMVGVVPVVVADGLAFLNQVSEIRILQKVEIIEVLLPCCETKNMYDIVGPNAQQLFFAKEESSCCARHFCGNIRPFDMVISDNMHREVIRLHRPMKFQGGCCCLLQFGCCCLQEIEVSSGGHLIGFVKQECSCGCKPVWSVENAQGETILKIHGPCCQFSCCCGDVDYQIVSADGMNEVGMIAKNWSGILREYFTDSDDFTITFPVNADLSTKSTLLGAAMLIDYMFYEK